jgi:glycosyltransferase involved in cell wall biosynthesis
MRTIAFVEPNPVAGGILRFATNLAAVISRMEPAIKITYFTAEVNYNQNKELFEGYRGLFKTRVLKSTLKTYTGAQLLDTAMLRLLNTTRAKLINMEIMKVTRDCDIVFFTNAHTLEFMKVIPPSFATFHDMLWKYQFGIPLFQSDYVSSLDGHIRKWLDKTRIIVPTPFVRSEILRFFPDSSQDIEVVYHSNFAQKPTVSREKDASILESLGIDRNYILYPSHLMPHKNHQSLFCAFAKLMAMEEFAGKYKLVLTGVGTDHFKYGKSFSMGMRIATKEDFDILGLGYIPNSAVDVVIRNASLVISTSLYEAGSGPALDAWISKVPVIVSDIEPHHDQLRFFGIDCVVFDPTDPEDIKDKIGYALTHLDELKGYSQSAYEKLDEYNWEVVGRSYLEIFRNKQIRSGENQFGS